MSRTPESAPPKTPKGRAPPPKNETRKIGLWTGTGFAISEKLLVTNFHVVEKCTRIRLPSSNAIAAIVAIDKQRDLAVIEASSRFSSHAAFRREKPRAGEPVMIAGFPLTGILGQGMSVTTGTTSAVSPLPRSPWLMSHTAPTQPGNSGGPIFDAYGAVIGVVQGRLNDAAVAQLTGSLPQNVNFGVSGDVAISFLTANKIDVPYLTNRRPLDGDTIAGDASKFTVLIHCFQD